MPPPIVPAPMTPTFCDRPRSACRAGCRGSSPPAARRRTRSAAPWTESSASSAMNSSRSFAHPLVERQVDGVPDRLDAFSQASKPRNLRALALRIASKISGLLARRLELFGAVAHFLQRRLLGDQAAREGDRALAQLAFLGEFVDHAPVLGLASRRTGRPRMTSSAFSTPTMRGRRCVPPAPGKRPSLISGRPHLADGTATR